MAIKLLLLLLLLYYGVCKYTQDIHSNEKRFPLCQTYRPTMRQYTEGKSLIHGT